MNTLRVIFISLLVSSCSESKTDSLEWVLTADPANDAKEAAGKGDYRLIGVGNMMPQLKTVPLIYRDCNYGSNVRYLMMDDRVESYEEAKHQAIAPVYAETYNLVLIEHLRAQGIDICNS